MYVKDPLQVKYYERKLGRKLTDAERLGEEKICINGQTFYLEIRELYFPYDFMDKLQLFSLTDKGSKWTLLVSKLIQLVKLNL